MHQFSQALLKGLLVCLLVFSITNSSPTVFAKEDGTESAKVTAQQPQAQYLLAYPGMLPDSPLYKLKVLRDKIATFLISDPMKKIDFYLLRADKGILASSMLLDKKEIALAKETALKAENNITELVRQLSSLPQKPEASLFERLMLASRTHQAIFEQMIKKTKGDDKKTFQDVLYFSKSNLETIKKLSKKNPSQWLDQTQ
ncbi:MAG: DUF5667 domain-containing protein [bacterium]|nr:DUF5667 domain-containing protein [bacterium]